MRPGQHVGKYVLGELIARGGMAEVWGARVEGPQGFVKSLALKFVLESFSGDSDLERLFVNEARLAAQLQHANLVSVFDFDKVPDPDGSSVGRYFIAMERVDGHDLRRVLQTAHHRGLRLPPALSLHVAGEVLKGLRYVHERRDPETQGPLGLIHRDVSPHNILVGFAGEVKLSDFGIAKAMTQNLGTQSGTIRGKLAYASPEQLRAEPLDHRTDQFALGVTLWEALAGQRLFDGPDELAIMSKVINGIIPPLPVAAGVDGATEAIVRRMLSPAARNRFPTTADALAAVLGARGYTADSGPLIALLNELFHPAVVELPRTAPLDPGVGAPPEPLRSGSTLRHDAVGETSPLEASEPARPAGGDERSSALRRRTPAPGTLPLLDPVREPTRSTTGSAYVSGAVPNEEFSTPRGRPATWVALGVLAAGLLTGGLVLMGRRLTGAGTPATGGLDTRPGVGFGKSERGQLDDEAVVPRDRLRAGSDIGDPGSARFAGFEAAGGGRESAASGARPLPLEQTPDRAGLQPQETLEGNEDAGRLTSSGRGLAHPAEADQASARGAQASGAPTGHDDRRTRAHQFPGRPGHELLEQNSGGEESQPSDRQRTGRSPSSSKRPSGAAEPSDRRVRPPSALGVTESSRSPIEQVEKPPAVEKLPSRSASKPESDQGSGASSNESPVLR